MVIGDAITPDSTINDDMVMGMNKGDNGTHAKRNTHAQSYALNHSCLCLLDPSSLPAPYSQRNLKERPYSKIPAFIHSLVIKS